MTTNCSVNVPLAGSTGTGNFVGANTPTLITPVLGVASATSINFGGGALSAYTTSTWTPSISIGGSTTGITYSAHTGVYTIIGNMLHFNLYINLSSIGGLSGTVLITGLPVAASGSNDTVSLSFFQNLTFSGTSLVATTNVNTTLSLFQCTSVIGSATLQGSNFANNTNFNMSGFYFI